MKNSQKCLPGLETSSNDTPKPDRNLRMSYEDYARTLWDWTPLNASFDRGIRLTDIDGFVEVKRHFLFIEGKANGKTLSRGQGMALRRLSESPRHTVIIINGMPPDVIREWVVIGEFANEVKVQEYTGSYDEFVAFVRLWFEWTDKG